MRLTNFASGVAAASRDVVVGKGGEFDRLDEAIKALLGKDVRQICICLLPGDHELDELAFELKRPDRFLTISGCGHGTRLLVRGQFALAGFGGVRLKDFTLVLGARGMVLDRCDEVEIAGCYMVGVFEKQPLIGIANASRISIADNRIEAHLRRRAVAAGADLRGARWAGRSCSTQSSGRSL